MAMEHTTPPASYQAAAAPHVESRRLCEDRLAERAAARARAAYPDTLPNMDPRRGRVAFLEKNKFELFDQNRDGYLDFDEFWSGEWATFLAFVRPGSCVMTKAEFMSMNPGASDAPDSGWSVPGQVQVIERLYAETDIVGKGYISKSDVRAGALRAFHFSDKRQKGKLSRADLGL